MKYKMTVVNAEKNIVKLTPTLGTYAKAFAPALVIWGVIGAAYAVQKLDDIKLTEENLKK